MAKAVKKAAKPAKKISGKKPRPHWKKDWKNAGKAWDAGLDVRRAMFGSAGAENQIADVPTMREMGYDQYRGIRHEAKHNLWRDGRSRFEVSPRSTGRGANRPLRSVT